ncbi:MAG: sigma-70 family RNA polymerase sigma factor [Bacteroidales bacterium]|nr:sigma-70 family RNA polymerase sigma factor [Bacteroidales bacterium]
MKRLSDEEILTGLRKRDNRVLQYIYKNSLNPVKQLILNNAGSDSDAEDIFQDALIIVFKKLKEEPDFELTSAFNTYIYSISRLLWLKHLRQIRKIEIDPLNRDMEERIEFEEPLPVQDKDLRMAIYQRTLLKIPVDCQKILRLTGQDITSKEIARQLGFRSEGYVRKRRHFCKEYLINKIKEDPDYQAMYED